MATIDKALPNEVRHSIEIGGNPKEQELSTPTPDIGSTEITPTEDGGVEINFEPGAVNQTGSENHFDNLAELLPDDILDPLGAELYENYSQYKSSRQDWEKAYTDGLDLLGFKYERRTQPFRGASGVTHPVLAEAVTQFQALAYKELLPAEGPVRTQVIGINTREKEDQANRVKDFMNFQVMDIMKEYEPEFDQMLFYLPLSGSTFKKVYYDSLMQRAVSKFIQAEDLVVPYNATSLDDAEAIMHVLKISENDLRKQQVAGFYKDVDLGEPGDVIENPLERKEKQLEGIRKGKQEDVFTLIECHVNIDLEGFEDRSPDGEITGIKLPYIVTIEENSRDILSIRRNFNANDVLKQKIQYFVHFKFLPGLGFYGFGLIHMIGGLSRTATSALRQLLDAGTLSNLPAGFKQRGIRVRDDAQPIQPGEFRDVDAPGGNLRDAFMPLPFKEPSATLLQLMGIVVQAGQRFASIADMQVGDGNQQAAVGTTMALLERGSRVMSAIHKRLYAGLKNEFELLAKVFSTYLPPVYPYDVVGGTRQIKAADFDDKIDILPIADPNIFSQTQRINLAQTEMQLAMSNPQMHNLYQVYRTMYEAIGVKNIDLILPPPQQPQPMDPSIEHITSMSGGQFQAFTGQDHKAHIEAHLSFMGLNMVKNNPMAMSVIQKNILEHISLMAQEHIQLEFSAEIKQLPMLQQQAQANPQMAPQLQLQIKNLMEKIESRKSILIAEMTKDYMEEENKINTGMDNDPLVKLKSREIDLKALENERKKKEAEDRNNLDKLKIISNRQVSDEKIAQTDDLTKLKIGVDLAKQGMQSTKISTN